MQNWLTDSCWVQKIAQRVLVLLVQRERSYSSPGLRVWHLAGPHLLCTALRHTLLSGPSLVCLPVQNDSAPVLKTRLALGQRRRLRRSPFLHAMAFHYSVPASVVVLYSRPRASISVNSDMNQIIKFIDNLSSDAIYCVIPINVTFCISKCEIISTKEMRCVPFWCVRMIVRSSCKIIILCLVSYSLLIELNIKLLNFVCIQVIKSFFALLVIFYHMFGYYMFLMFSYF